MPLSCRKEVTVAQFTRGISHRRLSKTNVILTKLTLLFFENKNSIYSFLFTSNVFLF